MRNSISKPALLSCLLSLLLISTSLLPARAVDRSTQERLDDLATKIVHKELELLRMNTYFRIETTDRGRFKPWRVFLYNLGGSGVSNAGIITVAAERWRTWQRPKTASRNTLKAGPLLLLIGHSIIAGGIVIEATLDAINDYKVKKKGFDPNTTKKRALSLRDEIDRLLQERDGVLAAASGLSDSQRDTAAAEGNVLRDVRDLALLEYSQFYVRSKKRRMVRDISYLNGMTAAATGGYIGSLNSLLAVSNRRASLAGPAGLGFLLSGAAIVAAPVVARTTGVLTGKVQSKKISSEIGTISTRKVDELNQHKQSLREAVSRLPLNERSPLLVNRQNIYDSAAVTFADQAKMNAAEKRKADREFWERLVFNAGVGGTKMGWGIQLAYGGFRYYNTPRRFSKVVAQGATTYTVGTNLWILDTLQARTRGEMDIYTLGAQQSLPHQKLSARLSKLEELDAVLNRAAVSHGGAEPRNQSVGD